MSEQQQALAAELLKDPDVLSLSSFIGVDGTNLTLNSGRMLITLKPKGERGPLADTLARLAERGRGASNMRLYLHPVQDLTIEDRVARTQYRFMLSSPDNEALTAASARLVERMRDSRLLANVASDLQDQGLQAFVDIDRAAAGRPRRHRRADRQCALQRVRPTSRVHHLHAVEPVPRGA